MVIINEKQALPPLAPPPPYVVATLPTNPPPFHHPHTAPTLITLQAHLILKIVYAAFPRSMDYEKHRLVLYWLATSLRATSRALYTACMHVLRSSYLPSYTQNVRPPYTSDPFPLTSSYPISLTYNSPMQTLQRETEVLDLYLLVKVREDVRTDESELHLDLDSFRDMFDMLQPKARTEDLVRQYGLQADVITLSPQQPGSSAIPFSQISISFSTRKVGLVLNQRGGRKRTLVEVSRDRDEKLESTARKLIKELERVKRV